ncbi:MAG: 50S ribosomal protein L10 [Actinomycetota bacterium]|nr:50S ribosomal protein L10 [Actinomycetota bacterium]
MNKDQKAVVVDEIAGQIQAAHTVFAVDYRGLSVTQAAQLRERLRESDTRLRVVKNSLSERAADKAGAELLKPMLDGPTALALVGGDAALAAKALSEAARTMGILDFKGGLMNGAAVSADDVRAIARLPAREVLHAQLVGAIASPVTGLVRTLNALIAGLAIQLKGIADQGLVSGGGSAEPPTAAEPEAAPAPEPEREPDPEPAPVAEAAAEPEPDPEPDPAAEAAAEPDPAAESRPAGEPEAPVGPAPAAEPEPDTATNEPDETEPDAGEASDEQGGTK